MLELNLKNVEEIIFYDKEVQLLMPDLRHLFDQYNLGIRVPGLKHVAQASVLDFMALVDETHLKAMTEYFKKTVIVERLKHTLVQHYDFNVTEDNELCKYSGYTEFSATRNKDHVSVTFWK